MLIWLHLEMVFHTKLGTKTSILRIIGFAIIVIVGFDPTNAKVGDIVMGMIQVWFFMNVALWLKTWLDLDGRH